VLEPLDPMKKEMRTGQYTGFPSINLKWLIAQQTGDSCGCDMASRLCTSQPFEDHLETLNEPSTHTH
jgi:hypothetical protein